MKNRRFAVLFLLDELPIVVDANPHTTPSCCGHTHITGTIEGCTSVGAACAGAGCGPAGSTF